MARRIKSTMKIPTSIIIIITTCPTATTTEATTESIFKRQPWVAIRRGEWAEEDKVQPFNPWNNPLQLNSQCQHQFARFDEREQLRHADHTDRGLLGE